MIVQSAALLAGLLLVGFGVWVARATISTPLVQLAKAATDMSKGNLNVDLAVAGTREVRELGASFDRMRASMVAAMGGGLGISSLDEDDI